MAARKNVSTGQIINALRQAEVGIANGKKSGRSAGIWA